METFRASADASPLLVWMTDAEHEVSWLNEEWYRWTGRTPEQELVHG